MNENIEDLPTPRGLEKMMQLQAMEQEVNQLRELSGHEMNQDNDFNSSLFPESMKNFEQLKKDDSERLFSDSGLCSSPYKEQTPDDFKAVM
jgi:hypothetical protein